ncbi:Polysaccharide pyruvyl transferase [Rhizobium sp. 9140]|nr:Polysaccharide pyruvyl transferase [Rhizobium sp. 9140]
MPNRKLPRILFNTVPFGALDGDDNSDWLEYRLSTGGLASLMSVDRDSGGNTGNFFHWEAPSKIIDCNAAESKHMRLWPTISASQRKDELKKHIELNYDAIVISEANFIQKETNFRVVTDFLSSLCGVDFYLFGAGVQDAAPQSFADLTQGTGDFLRLMDKKASLFGTRGPQTSEALNNLGLHNHDEIGCPSLYAFPRQVMAITSPTTIKKIATAGHITKQSLLDGLQRAKAVEDIANKFDSAYVFQAELPGYNMHESLSGEIFAPDFTFGLYDKISNTIDKHYINRYLSSLSGREFRFSKYYYFRDTISWRKAMESYDLYIGDRFHGGVACMQVGKPAVFLTEDLRAAELASFIGAPTINASSFDAVNIPDIISDKFSDQRLSYFREKYMDRFNNFKSALRRAGLELK